jgi:hypothetical protein
MDIERASKDVLRMICYFRLRAWTTGVYGSDGL